MFSNDRSTAAVFGHTAIRYHNGELYFLSRPGFWNYVTKTKNPLEAWSERFDKAGKG